MGRKPSKTVRVRVRDLEDVKNIMSDVEAGYKGVFVMATAQSLVEYLKISAPDYQYISRAEAYGEPATWNGDYTIKGKHYTMQPVKGYFSAKQFRFVRAGIADGTITPGTSQRTGAVENGWYVDGKPPGLATIRNKAAGAPWTVHDYWQARQPALVGWQKTSVTIQENIDDAMVDGINAVLDAAAKKGKR
jgi:hypothetical protein